MNRIDRIKSLQVLVGVVQDGVIGWETMSKFAAKYNRNRVQVIHFFASIHHETGEFTIGRENMNYTSVARIMEIFGKGNHSAGIVLEEAKGLVRQGRKLAERVYGLGNPRKARELGNSREGDGWRFRGGGALQCTGGGDYLRYGGELLYNNPDLISTGEFYFETAIREFDFKNIWSKAVDLSERSTRAVCRVVNGGYNGINDRIAKVAYYSALWPIAA